MSLFWILLPISLLYVLVSPDAREEVVKWLLTLIWIPVVYLPLSGQVEETVVTFEAPPPVESTPRGSAVAGLGDMAVLAVQETHQAPPAVERAIASRAAEALAALEEGADFDDTVLRCYARMLEVVRDDAARTCAAVGCGGTATNRCPDVDAAL